MIQKKICMLGAYAVGKTSLVSRYVYSRYSEKYQSTIGVKIDKKTIDMEGETMNLILWDLYGEDQFQQMRTSYLRGASGYLLVADGTRPKTLEIAQSLQQRTQAALGQIPFILLLNKWDLQEQWQLKESQLEPLEQAGWTILRSSAKTGENVEAGFLALGQQLMQRHQAR